MFRKVADCLSLDAGLVCDGVTIVSELAANSLHVKREQAEAGTELWLYLRGGGSRRELVCKVFDSYPGWLSGAPYGGSVCGHARRVPPEAMSGRGLEVVHELSGGRWGYHLSRSRLGGRHIRGKAVWFALPVTACGDQARVPAISGGRLPRTAVEAMTELEVGLAARGFGDALVRANDPSADMAVLSVCNGITAWCRAGSAWLRAPGVSGQRWGYHDLVEVTEQAVEAHETLVGGEEVRELATASRTGASTALAGYGTGRG
jgi:hypothetical protein